MTTEREEKIMDQNTKDRRIAAAEKEIEKATLKREKAQRALDSTATILQEFWPRKATGRPSIARPGWTLSTGDSDFHAARGAARIALNCV